MAIKRIRDLDENTTADDTDLVLTESASGTTLKTKLINLLKRVFAFEDVWEDYVVALDASNTLSANNSPTMEEFRSGIYALRYPVDIKEHEAFFTFHFHHDMKPDTDMHIHCHFTTNDESPTGNVKWNVDYMYARGYEADTFPAPTTLSVVAPVGAQYSHQITDDEAMIISATANDLEPDGLLMGRVYRNTEDIEDTCDSDTFLLYVDIHYVKNRVGTTERNRPFTSGGFGA